MCNPLAFSYAKHYVHRELQVHTFLFRTQASQYVSKRADAWRQVTTREGDDRPKTKTPPISSPLVRCPPPPIAPWSEAVSHVDHRII